MILKIATCAMVKTWYLGYGHPSIIGDSFVSIKPYSWGDTQWLLLGKYQVF